MLVVHVLKALWSLLPPRRRWVFSALVGLLFVSGLFEMGSMVMIFGFIRGLSPNDTGERQGPVARALYWLLDSPIDPVQYSAVGGALVVLFILGKNGLSTLVHFGITRFMMKTNQNVSRRLFESFLLAPYKKVMNQGVKKLHAQVKGSFVVLNDCFSNAAQILADLATLTMVVALLLFVDLVLTLTAATIFGLAGTALYWTMQRNIRRLGDQTQKATTEANRLVWEGLSGLIDTRLRHAHAPFVARYSKALSDSARHSRRLGGMKSLPRSTNEILLTSMIVASVLYLSITDQSITEVVPTLALFGFAGMRLTGAMSRVNSCTQSLRQKVPSFDHYLLLIREHAPDLFAPTHEAAPPKNYLSRRVGDGESGIHPGFTVLTFEDVAFSYVKDVDVLHDLSFVVPRGKFVSFCGPSGGGKSTLLLLFMALLHPTRGKVTCDGINVVLDVVRWHSMIGYVGQDYFLTEGTVRDNVAFGEPLESANDEKVWRALSLASADEFVRELPEQLDTTLLSGRRLSGGQRQRIAIARALYRDPDILVLDEATAALDNETERAISTSIAEASKGKTVVCVAHRLSTIRNSDVIHFMVGGTIVASGSYDELLASCPEFKRMAEATEQGEEAL